MSEQTQTMVDQLQALATQLREQGIAFVIGVQVGQNQHAGLYCACNVPQGTNSNLCSAMLDLIA